MGPLAKEALRLFYKQFGRKMLKTAADNKWVTDMVKTLKNKTQKIADKVRKDLKTEKRQIPKEWNKFKPEIVKPIKVPEQTKNILNIKSTLKGRPVKVVPEPKVGDAMKVFKEVVVGPDKHILRPKIIKFPKPFKKPPRKPKADGGSIDKALPGRSRDI